MALYRELLIAALISSIYTKIKGKLSIPLFTLFLTFWVLFELVLRPLILSNLGKNQSNFWYYNILIIIQVQYFAWVYYQHFLARKFSRNILVISLIITGISILNFFFGQGMHTVNNMTYILGLTFIMFLIGAYFTDILKDERERKITSEPMFWLSIGILLFYASCLPFLIFVNNIVLHSDPALKSLYTLVQAGNVFLSLSYIMVSLCTLKISSLFRA